jgi:hypothetical protein
MHVTECSQWAIAGDREVQRAMHPDSAFRQVLGHSVGILCKAPIPLAPNRGLSWLPGLSLEAASDPAIGPPSPPQRWPRRYDLFLPRFFLEFTKNQPESQRLAVPSGLHS